MREGTLAERYAQLTAAASICFVFSLAMPLLLPTAALIFCVAYWLEVCAFSWLYLKPPFLSIGLATTVSRLLPFVLMAHCGVSCWLLTGPSLSVPAAVPGSAPPPKDAFGAGLARATQQRNIGELMLIAGALCIAFSDALRSATRLLLCWGELTVCGSRALHKYLTPEPPPKQEPDVYVVEESMALERLRLSYRDALRSNFLSDVPSYDIRDNPAYFAAFGLAARPLKFTEYVAPDPGPPRIERTLANLAPGEPNSENSALVDTTRRNHINLVEKMAPTQAQRSAVYGPGLDDEEAVIRAPKRKAISLVKSMGRGFKNQFMDIPGGDLYENKNNVGPVSRPEQGEGRVGLVFKDVSKSNIFAGEVEGPWANNVC